MRAALPGALLVSIVLVLVFGVGCGKADEAIEELEALKARGCACEQDADPMACADRVQQDFSTFMDRHADTKGTDRQVEQVAKLATELSECLTRAAMAGAP